MAAFGIAAHGNALELCADLHQAGGAEDRGATTEGMGDPSDESEVAGGEGGADLAAPPYGFLAKLFDHTDQDAHAIGVVAETPQTIDGIGPNRIVWLLG